MYVGALALRGSDSGFAAAASGVWRDNLEGKIKSLEAARTSRGTNIVTP